METIIGALKYWETPWIRIMILVFGKTGQVAIELQRLANVTALGREESDLSDPQACVTAIKMYRPAVVINAAAYTNVDRAEDDEAVARIINGDAPTAMAAVCAEMNIPFVHISTDYVFDGSGKMPWKPEDNPSPVNAYGRSKLLGEIGVRNSGAIYAILRTSWVISAHGSNFVKTMLRLSQGSDTLQVVNDQIGGPTPAQDIATVCLQIANDLIGAPDKSGIYHFSGAPDVSWAELANEIFEQTRRSVSVTPIVTAEYITSATRPLNSRLDCNNTEMEFNIKRADWREGLKKILKDIEGMK